jgi:heme-degrading monooxygenase HmoA
VLQIRPLDEVVPIQAQLGEHVAPVVLVNIFHVDPEEADALLEAWAADAAWMKQQPGFISAQLHRGIGGSAVFLNYAVWESVAHFRAAFAHPDFRDTLANYPPSAVVSPHLFAKVAVPDICDA